jgi:RND superfamily putative drug exporter
MSTVVMSTRFPAQAGDTDQIVFHTRTGNLTGPSVRAVIDPLLSRISQLPHVSGVVSPYTPGAGSISTSGTIGFASVQFDKSSHDLADADINKVISTAETARSSAADRLPLARHPRPGGRDEPADHRRRVGRQPGDL